MQIKTKMREPPTLRWLRLLPFLNILFIYSRRRERERESDSAPAQAEGKSKGKGRSGKPTEQGAQHRAQSQDPSQDHDMS